MSPSQFRGRPSVTSYLYDGERLVRTVTASAWTSEDRALMLAWRMYDDGLHKPCGHPRETAMHPENSGEFESLGMVTCWACTAIAQAEDPNAKPVRFPIVVDTRDYTKNPLPPWPDLTETT